MAVSPLLIAFITLASPTMGGEADAALRKLRDGNHRFVTGFTEHPRQSAEDRRRVAKGQTPHTVVITCSDSRVVPELLFDQGLGDLFVVRVAGNTVGDRELGSIEYALEHLGARLVLVLGHSKCGAVQAALANQSHYPGALGSIVKPIRPAAEKSHGLPGDHLANAVKQNVRMVAKALGNADLVMRHDTRDKGVRIQGAVYDLESGVVKFLADAPAVHGK